VRARLAARYEAILAAVPDIIVEVDRNKVYTWANPAALDFFGPDLLGQEAAHYFVGTQDTYEKVQRLFQGDQAVFYVESWQRRQDGQPRLLAWWCRVLKDAEGNVVGALSAARDITERKQTEEALRKQLDELFAVFNGVDGAVFIADMETHEVLAANEHVERVFGADWRGKKCYHVLQANQTGPCPFCTTAALLGKDGTPAPPLVWEFQNTKTQRWYHCIDRAIRWPDGRWARLEIALDVTEHKRGAHEKERLEAQLRQSRKLEALGQLAGGVAHDFNNILTAIMGNVEMLRSEFEHGARNVNECATHLDQIDRAAQRAAALIHQLLTFSRRQAARLELLNLNQILIDLRPMLERLISENIALELDLNDGLASVQADRGQIEQVIMNLVVNARDAMPEGGRVVLRTANATLADVDTTRDAEPCRGRYVLLSVRDSGRGMPPEVLEHVFEPFYTTKPPGQGTGLGLATVYGIVKQAKGYVTASSQPDSGSTFEVYWPASDAPAAPAARLPDETRQAGGDETVLVCEDDRTVRELAASFLRTAGYTVLAAENGKQALELAADQPAPIHLLLTDVVMPDVNGRQLAAALSAARPALKTVFMSGYAANLLTENGSPLAGLELLEKPFSRERLLQCVRDVLDQAQVETRPL
jgi:PAS domain S-box-containing protein